MQPPKTKVSMAEREKKGRNEKERKRRIRCCGCEGRGVMLVLFFFEFLGYVMCNGIGMKALICRTLCIYGGCFVNEGIVMDA